MPLVRLAPSHQLGAFACGDEEIDSYLRDRALVEQAQGFNTVWVMVDQSETVQAYFTLSPLSVRVDKTVVDAMKAIVSVPYTVIGGYLLGRLGVRRDLAGRGIGSALVARAIDIGKAQRAVTGGVFLAVDPKSAGLRIWYEKLGLKGPITARGRMIATFL